jgi:Trypsin-like peptidase domain
MLRVAGAGGVMQRGLLSIVVLLVASCRVEAGCVDSTSLDRSTVGIARYFDAEERQADPGVLGVRGTGWFLSPTYVATVEHVATGMNLSPERWKQIEIRSGEKKESIAVRIRQLLGAQAEKIAVLELMTALSGVRGLALRTEPLVPEEQLTSLAYPGDHLRVAGGRFVQYGEDEKFAGMALLEMYDGNDRLVLDHGASGAPVIDCDGRIVAVVSNLFTSTLQIMSRAVRISTAWGSANVSSVPAQVLKDFPRAE